MARTAVRAAAARLADIGRVASPLVDAELLVAHVLGVSRGALLTAEDLTADQLQALDVLLDRRAQGVPLQHLLGSAPYRYLEVAIGPGVFIPRPETELLVELAATSLRTAGLVVDLCSGSGAVALAVATEFPATEVIAVERSQQALVWLRRNVAAIAPRVRVTAADVADPTMLAEFAGTVDVVLANPPYVPAATAIELAPEIGFDPAEAVFAAGSGLGVIAHVISAAQRLLKPGGLLVVEHDDSHQDGVLALFSDADWTAVQRHRDLTGRPRFVSAVRD
jgi:release factor glutamine methyltransferase